MYILSYFLISGSGRIVSIPVENPRELQDNKTFTAFPLESRVDMFAQTDDHLNTSHSDTDNVTGEHGSFRDLIDAGIQTDEEDVEQPPDMLLPQNHDVMFGQLPPLQEKDKKKTKKKNTPPRAMIGVLALQAEHNPVTKANLKQEVQSLRVKGGQAHFKTTNLNW